MASSFQFGSRAVFLSCLACVLLMYYHGRALRAVLSLQHAAYDYPVIPSHRIWNDLQTVDLTEGHNYLVLCPLKPPELVGPLSVSLWASKASWSKVSSLHPTVQPGGQWSPPQCTSRHHLHLVIPYRDRESQLKVALNHLHPFLQRQLIRYRIVVVEQTTSQPFNRAKLFNVGFVESLNMDPSPSPHCFIFHDVDLLPENDFNVYGCSRQPRHVSSSIDNFRYNLPYPELFGGVTAMTDDHFQRVNGFSNRFFGWGGEDDDMFNRIVSKRMNITRWPASVARYKMLRHAKEPPSNSRYTMLKEGENQVDQDGLNTLKYTKRSMEERPLYTWLLVDL